MLKSSDFCHKIQKALKNVGFYRVVFQRVYTPMGCLNVITITLFLICKLKLFLEVLIVNDNNIRSKDGKLS